MMYCPNWGAQMDDDARFCPNCGNMVSPPAPPEPEAPLTPPAPPEEAPVFNQAPPAAPDPGYYQAPPYESYQAPPAAPRGPGFMSAYLGAFSVLKGKPIRLWGLSLLHGLLSFLLELLCSLLHVAELFLTTLCDVARQ